MSISNTRAYRFLNQFTVVGAQLGPWGKAKVVTSGSYCDCQFFLPLPSPLPPAPPMRGPYCHLPTLLCYATDGSIIRNILTELLSVVFISCGMVSEGDLYFCLAGVSWGWSLGASILFTIIYYTAVAIWDKSLSRNLDTSNIQCSWYGMLEYY